MNTGATMRKKTTYTLVAAALALATAAVGLAKEFVSAFREAKPATAKVAVEPSARAHILYGGPKNPYLQGSSDEAPSPSDPEEAEALAKWHASREAGFAWARDKNIKDLSVCTELKKGPFRKGCVEWVSQQAS